MTHKATFQEDDNEVEIEIHAHESSSEGELSPSNSEADSDDEIAETMNQSTVSGNSVTQSEESEIESQSEQVDGRQQSRSKKDHAGQGHTAHISEDIHILDPENLDIVWSTSLTR